MILELLAYFAVGVLLDITYTIWYMGISDNDIVRAMAGSFLVTILSYSLLSYLILSSSFIPSLLAYAIGCACGTGITMWYKNYRGTISKTT